MQKWSLQSLPFKEKRKPDDSDDQGWLDLGNRLKDKRTAEPAEMEAEPVMDTTGDIDSMTRRLLMIGLDREEVQWIMAGSKRPDKHRYDQVRQYCDHDTCVQRHTDHVQENTADESMFDRMQQSPGLVRHLSR